MAEEIIDGYRLLRHLQTGQSSQVWEVVHVASAGQVRIIDFALAQRIPKGFFARLFWRRRKAQGTRSYMSPEQIRGLPLDTRADIYSFGVNCFEVVTGRVPFRGNSSQELLTKH